MRVVIDSDILLAAYTEEGEIRAYWQKGEALHVFLISPEIFTAVETTLRQSSGKWLSGEIRDFLKDILKRCTLIRLNENYTGEGADERDRSVIHLAMGSKADAILTGKAALQKMKTAGGIPVLSFSQFMTKI